MKTQNLNKLAFSRATVTELTENEMTEVNGGITSLPCLIIICTVL